MAPSQKTSVIDIIGSFIAGTVRAILRHHADLYTSELANRASVSLSRARPLSLSASCTISQTLTIVEYNVPPNERGRLMARVWHRLRSMFGTSTE